jgi:O-antigen ligase
VITGPTAFRRTRAGLIAAAFLAPFSATHLLGPLTLGRTTALIFAALLAADLLIERPHQFWLDPAGLLLGGAYVGLSAWIFLNSAAWGCNCNGKVGGFSEFAVIGLLAIVAISFEPRLREAAIAATLAGIVLAAALALAGVGALNSATVDLSQTGGRLSGTFGNANELGFSAALGIPVALAYCSIAGRAGRIAGAATIVLLTTTLVLTYSRGAIIAAGVGILALYLWQEAGSRRRVTIILAAASLSIGLAAVLYTAFERERRDVSFTAVSPALRGLDQRDLSGWDSRALGPIPNGPSKLLNMGSAFAVRARRGGEGASFRWGEASAGSTYTLRFRARSESARLPFSYELGDSSQKVEGPRGAGELDQRWRSFSLVWNPRLRSPQATLYIWQRAGPSTVALADVRVIAHSRSGRSQVIAVPGHLVGSLYQRFISVATRAEGRYTRSRLDASHLALEAFDSEPLRGIGWGTFPTYAAAHLHFGLLAAHDEYLAFAAELGVLGALLLILLIAAVAIGVKWTGPGWPEAAAIGLLAAAAAGMVFVEALPTPQLSIAMAIAAAVLCARSPVSQGELDDPC